jgi:phospholipid/cholesterol/gamma-HCH transport system substrate-binding protein
MPGLITEAKSMAADARASLKKTDEFIGSVNGLALKLDQRVDTLTHAVVSVEEVGVTARTVGEDTMPRMHALIDDVSKETRTLGRVINTLGDNPQSIVFGTPPGRPGPGEPGFTGGR